MVNKKCKFCGKEIDPPKRKFCSKLCCDKWLYHNNENYRKRIIKNSRKWEEKNPEKNKKIHKRAMDKYVKTNKFRESVLKNYYNNKEKWKCRKVTRRLKAKGIIELVIKCKHKNNLEIHHEIYPNTKKGIINAVEDGKIYYLCQQCHKTK